MESRIKIKSKKDLIAKTEQTGRLPPFSHEEFEQARTRIDTYMKRVKKRINYDLGMSAIACENIYVD